MTTEPTPSVKRRLALKSGDRCAFPDCPRNLSVDATPSDPGAITGEIAHIAGENPTAARYDGSMSDEERREYANLIYLCGDHHTEIDRQEKTFPVWRLREFKARHERHVFERLRAEQPNVGFAELEVLTKAIAGPRAASDGNLDLLPLREKMAKNDMSEASHGLLTMATSTTRQTSNFVELSAALDPDFPDRIRAGFQAEYRRLFVDGFRGDELFEALCDFASRGSSDIRRRVAGIGIVGYLFERCEVFER